MLSILWAFSDVSAMQQLTYKSSGCWESHQSGTRHVQPRRDSNKWIVVIPSKASALFFFVAFFLEALYVSFFRMFSINNCCQEKHICNSAGITLTVYFIKYPHTVVSKHKWQMSQSPGIISMHLGIWTGWRRIAKAQAYRNTTGKKGV